MLKYTLCFLLGISSLIAVSPSLKPSRLPIEFLLDLSELYPTASGFLAVPFKESVNANAQFLAKPAFFQDKAVRNAKQLFENFCLDSTPSRSARPPIIPRLIHLIWLGSPIPTHAEISIASWRKYHPDWEIKVWTDADVESFQWSNTRSEFLFHTLRSWSEKSDVLRFEILYQFGGIYSDTDVICLKPFDDLITGPSFLTCFEKNSIDNTTWKGRPLIGSSIVGAVKGHPTTKRCLDFHCTSDEAPTMHLHLRSGPGPISRASYEALDAGKTDILVLPCSYFYPLPVDKRLYQPKQIQQLIRPESFAIHLWDNSWANTPPPRR